MKYRLATTTTKKKILLMIYLRGFFVFFANNTFAINPTAQTAQTIQLFLVKQAISQQIQILISNVSNCKSLFPMSSHPLSHLMMGLSYQIKNIR